MGARLYDPTTTTFLSPDPLTPPAGALWVNNPNESANNHPLTLTDPLGTHPVTDDQLAGLTHPVRHWWATHKDHILSWQFGLGVLAVGIGLTATGFGAGAGIGLITAATSGALISGGSTLAIEKYSTGDVNWANVGKQAAIGFITGAVTAGTSNFLDSQLLKFPGKTAEKAMTEFGNITKINKAGTGIWSQLNGASKAQRAFKMAVDHGWEDAIKENIGNEFLGDIVVQPIASGAEYISDSVINHKKFSMTDLMLANVDGEFTAILPGGIRTAVRANAPTRNAISSMTHPRLHQFARHLEETTREAAWSTASNATRNGLWSLMKHDNTLTPDTITQDGAETIGESIHAGFGAHAEDWTSPHLHPRSR